MNRANFTSETLRLEPLDSACSNSKERDSERTNSLHVQAAVLSASQSFQKKKVSSFQITSIRPTSRSSNDGGDDSENDTEDTSDILDSSRVNFDFDQETPSFSEDISKSEDLLGSGPVIPASSQYGITALVQPTGTGGMMTARFPQGVTVNVTEGGLALAKADGEPDDLDNWQKRFKIVKIDSNKPFKRGRWVCLDFMDSPALNAAGGRVEEMPKLVMSNIISDSESSDPSGILEIPFTLSTYAPPSSQSNSNQTSGQINTPAPSTQVHGGTLYTNNMGQPIQVVIPGYAISPQLPPHGPVISSCQASSRVSTTSQSTIAGSNSIHSNTDVSVCGLNSVPNIAVSIQPGVNQQNVQNVPQSHAQPVTMQTEQAQGMSLTPVNSSSSSSNISNVAHGLQPQVVGISSQSQSSAPTNVPLVNKQSQNSQPANSLISQPIILSQQVSQSVSSSQQVPQTVASSQQISQSISAQQQSQSSILQPTLQNATNTNQLVTGSCSNVINAAASQIFTSIPNSAVSPTPVTSPAQAQSQISAGTLQQLILSESHQLSTSTSIPSSQHPPSTLDGLTLQGVDANATSTATPPTGVAPSDDPESFHGLVKALSNVAAGSSYGHQDFNVKYAYTPSPIFTPPLNTPPLMTDATPVIDVPAAAAATLQAVGNHREHSVERSRAKEASFSASTASTVAIDNKIEQAMDLVKSHLMFAVREEVDVLKEKIVELMDRINHLECENNLLRQYASPDVLQQLQTQLPHQMQQPPHHSSTS